MRRRKERESFPKYFDTCDLPQWHLKKLRHCHLHDRTFMLFRLKIEVSCYYYGDMISLEINQDILKIFGFL